MKIEDAKKKFQACQEAEDHNRKEFEDDIRFGRMGDHWPREIEEARRKEGRPTLTLNNLNTFIRQVTNDVRLNKPAIKVFPADSFADKETAQTIQGLIRNIEYTSDGQVAYQTASEYAVSGGFGYWRVDIDYASNDSFDSDLKIRRIVNPLSVYGDPESTEADSSDWNCAFITDSIHKDAFEKEFDKEPIDWDAGAYADLKGTEWRDGDHVLLAEYWVREEIQKEIYLLEDNLGKTRVVDEDSLNSGDIAVLVQNGGLRVISTRSVPSFKVTKYLMTGAEILEEEDWPGIYIPIIPVYGDEVYLDGKRHFRSLIRDVKDAMRERNYWRSAQTELVALAPRVPWVAEEGSLVRPNEWEASNRHSYGVLTYKKGRTPPQRQLLDAGPALGAAQNAQMANDDIKAIIGLYDASIGARSNEVSGKAILARQREGDVSTYHFIDNLSRAIRHTGRVLIDLIPHVYNTERIVRVIGDDDRESAVPVNQKFSEEDADGNVIVKIHDLRAGKYDLVVQTGPSFTTKRQEAAEQMMTLVQQFPASAPLIGGLIAKNLDWPGADELAERIEALIPPEVRQNDKGIPPQLQELIQTGKAEIERLTQENQSLKADKSVDQIKVQIEQFRAQTDRLKAETERLVAESEKIDPIAIEDTKIKQFEAQTKRLEAEIKKLEAEAKALESTTNVDVNEGLKETIQSLQSAIELLVQVQTVPKRVVRDENDEIISVEPVLQ